MSSRMVEAIRGGRSEGLQLSLVSCWFGLRWVTGCFWCSLVLYTFYFLRSWLPAVSHHRSMQRLVGPFLLSLVIQLHFFYFGTHTCTLTHAFWSFSSLLMNRHLFSMPLIRSFSHPFIQLSHRETNKCVTCQQSIISPQSDQINLSLCLLLSCPSCFPFIQRLSTHSLVSLSNLCLVQL